MHTKQLEDLKGEITEIIFFLKLTESARNAKVDYVNAAWHHCGITPWLHSVLAYGGSVWSTGKGLWNACRNLKCWNELGSNHDLAANNHAAAAIAPSSFHCRAGWIKDLRLFSS